MRHSETYWGMGGDYICYNRKSSRSKKKVKQIIFDYKQALKSKVWKKVDEEIWILEIMKEYSLSYNELMNETPIEVYELMKQKMIAERKNK